MGIRKEDRYLIDLQDLGKFRKEIGKISTPKIFPSNYNHTIYFNNQDHEVPFEVSVKGRRYSPEPFNGQLGLDGKWILEIKQDSVKNRFRLREKIRTELGLEEILMKLKKDSFIKFFPLAFNLEPYVVDSCRREHHLINNEEDFRITIDDDLGYSFFDGKKVVYLGKEDFARVEIKIPPCFLDSEEKNKISDLIIKYHLIPVISKKDSAYNLLGKYLRSKSSKKIPESDTEMEAKFLLGKEQQYVFNSIKRDFEKGDIEGFAICKEIPHVFEDGRLHYYIPPFDAGIRLGLKGKSKTITLKENSETIKGDLIEIVKRKETKPDLSIAILESTPICRKRKYFVTENLETNNSYSITVDRCTFEDKELFQMEIEGLLFSPSKFEENRVVKDICYIGKKLITKYPFLKPTSLTKRDWFVSLKKD